MELTLIAVALLAAAGGLVVVAASVLRWTAVHRQDLLAAGRRASDRLRMQWLQDLMVRLRPTWSFGVSAALGPVVIASAAVGAGTLIEDVTDGDGIPALDHPVASFVTAHRTGALTVAMRAASTVGGRWSWAPSRVAAGVVLGIIWRSRGRRSVSWPVLRAAAWMGGAGGTADAGDGSQRPADAGGTDG